MIQSLTKTFAEYLESVRKRFQRPENVVKMDGVEVDGTRLCGGKICDVEMNNSESKGLLTEVGHVSLESQKTLQTNSEELEEADSIV